VRRLLVGLLVAVCALPLVPAARAAMPSPPACSHAVIPFADLPGASLTPRDLTSKDAPPVRYTLWRGTVPSFDGMPLSVDVTVPCGVRGPAPLVSMHHGWTDDKTIWEETGRGDKVVSSFRRAANSWWNNIWFASQGDVVLTYTSRGWHDSCGPDVPGAVKPLTPAPQCAAYKYWIHLDDQRWEIRDTQWLVAGLVSSGVADPARLAVTGGSYGGGQAIQNALLADRVVCGASPVPPALGPDPCAGHADGDMVPWTTRTGQRVRWAAAVPMYTWSDIVQVLLPNGRGSDGWAVADRDHHDPIGVPIQSYIAGLLGAGQPLGNGFYAPPGVDPTADIVTSAARVLAGNPFLPADPVVASSLPQFSRFKSAAGIPLTRTSARVPMFWVQGQTDPLFPATEVLQVYNRLRSLDPRWPIKLFLGDIGHDYAAERVDDWDAAHASMNAFLDHYLHPTRTRRAPAFDVTSSVTRCLAPTAPQRLLRAPTWTGLHPFSLRLTGAPSPVVSSSAVVTSVGLATDPVSSATLPLPGAYKGCRKMAPAADDPNAATWSFPVGDRGLLLAGGPVVDVSFGTTAPDTELNVRLWDVAPGGAVEALVTRGTYRSLDAPALGDLHARFQLMPNTYRFEPGHSLKLEITANDFPYHQTSNVPALLTIGGMTLDLPLAARP
jgi:hypothetical protein